MCGDVYVMYEVLNIKSVKIVELVQNIENLGFMAISWGDLYIFRTKISLPLSFLFTFILRKFSRLFILILIKYIYEVLKGDLLSEIRR